MNCIVLHNRADIKSVAGLLPMTGDFAMLLSKKCSMHAQLAAHTDSNVFARYHGISSELASHAVCAALQGIDAAKEMLPPLETPAEGNACIVCDLRYIAK